MAPQDAEKTAIITPVGLYQYKMMPFWPVQFWEHLSTFHRSSSRGLDFCFAYVDDILIASRSLKEHKGHLRLLLDHFRQNDVVLNKSKCEFAINQLTF